MKDVPLTLSDAAGLSLAERSDHPYGGMDADIERFWSEWSPQQRACYNLGFSKGSDRAREEAGKSRSQYELKALRQFHEVVTRIVTRDYGGDPF